MFIIPQTPQTLQNSIEARLMIEVSIQLKIWQTKYLHSKIKRLDKKDCNKEVPKMLKI
jgi:hypothetical protein